MSDGLTREVFGRPFQNPILLAAGTAAFGHELDGVMDLTRLGGIVTKSVSLHPRSGNQPPRVAEFRGGMVNSVGLANPGVAAVVRDDLPRLREIAGSAQILLSIVGFELAEYGRVVEEVADLPDIAAFELNLSCPNTSQGGVEFGADPGAVEAIVSGCRRLTKTPLLAKLSPASPDLGTLAKAALAAGADGISVVNTMPGRLYDGAGHDRLGNGRGGVSGPGLLAVGLQATTIVRESIGAGVIVGVGGIRRAADVKQYLRAGADLVAIGTAALADPRLPERIVKQLGHYHG